MSPVRRLALYTGVIVLIATTGCGSGATMTEAAPTTGPAATAQTTDGTVTASAEVEPAQWSDLAFTIDGRVRSVDVKAGDRVLAGQQLIVLDLPDLEYAAITAQAEADSAEINQFLQRSSRQYKVWNGRRWVWTNGPQELRLKADARLQRAQGALDVARAELAQGTLVAPFDGTVASVDVLPGEMVQANTAVLVLGDLDHLQIVTTDLSERQIARLRPGQAVAVRLKAFEDTLQGSVSTIEMMAGKSDDGDTVFKVTIELDQQPPQLRWGMTGEVEIEAPSRAQDSEACDVCARK